VLTVVPERDGWRAAARVLLVLAALTTAALAVSGAWLWFEYHPGPSATLRVVHQIAAIALVVVAVGLLFVAIARRLALRVAGVVAAVGVLVTTLATVVTGRLLPWDQLALSAFSTVNDIDRGVQAVADSRVVFVLMDGREITPSTYQFWAYAHLGFALLVATAIVLAWMRTRELPGAPAVVAEPAAA
jgi:quinol-cytochrome oxidoreductase complex cytochrome b subunit